MTHINKEYFKKRYQKKQLEKVNWVMSYIIVAGVITLLIINFI